MIIVDDCSEDNSKEIISELSTKDKRIKPIFLEKNVGAAEARNTAIRQSKGKYVAFLDSDDLWNPKKLEIQLSFMNKNEIVFSYTNYQLMSENGEDISNFISAPEKMTYDSYLKNTIIGCLTVIIDREKSGEFEMPNICSSHDMALWLLIMRKGFDAYGLDENLARYRIVSTSNTANKWRAAKDVWMVYRQFEKLSFFYSIWCFSNYAFNAIIKRI
jgi:teichuronic acid biosynthesis glycosyltransferase TuaG